MRGSLVPRRGGVMIRWRRLAVVALCCLAVVALPGSLAVGSPAAHAAALPAAPSHLALSDEGATAATLNFRDNSTDELQFVVERRTWPVGGYAVVRTVVDHRTGQPAATGWTMRSTVAYDDAALYCYRVKAVNSAGAAASPAYCAAPTTSRSFSFYVQKPYDLPLSTRYAYASATDTHTMWVYATDKPFKEGSGTDPRTEMRWYTEYDTGHHMWEADVFVPPGTDGTTIMQIFRPDHADGEPATDFMLNVYADSGGSFRPYSNGTVLRTGVYNRWWNIKVAHDTRTHLIRVYIDDQLAGTLADRGPGARHFKNGVYHHGSGRAEARFRAIRYRVW